MTVAVRGSRDLTKSEQSPIFVGQFGTNGTDRDFLRTPFFPPSPILFHSSWPTRVGVCSCFGGVRTAHDAEWNSLEQMEHFGTPTTCSTLFRSSYSHFVSLVSPDRGRSLRNRSPAERVSLKGHHPASETSLDSRLRGNDGMGCGNDGGYTKVSFRGNDGGCVCRALA